MFNYIPLEQQIALERKKNAKLTSENIKLKSKVDYIAMMTDINLSDDTVAEEASDNEE